LSPASPSAAAKQRKAEAPPSFPPPSVSEAVEVESAQVQVATSQPQEQALNLARSQPSEGLFDKSSAAPVGKAKPAENADAAAIHGTVGGPVPLNGRNVTQLSALLPAAIPRWAITASGGLQRSFDQGKSWQDVDVNRNLAPSSAGMTKLALVGGLRAAQKDSDKKVAPAPLSVPLFRAVSANAADVWVGGSNGALYHSLDAGNRWIRVVPISAGAALTADIVAVEFTDAQHGKITTAGGEVWITADAGQTWQKQKP